MTISDTRTSSPGVRDAIIVREINNDHVEHIEKFSSLAPRRWQMVSWCQEKYNQGVVYHNANFIKINAFEIQIWKFLER